MHRLNHGRWTKTSQDAIAEIRKQEPMFALDIKKLEAHEKELGAVSRLETSTINGEILLMFFHVGEGWSERALIETIPASKFAIASSSLQNYVEAENLISSCSGAEADWVI